MATLTGGLQPVDLGRQFRITTPGLQGTATLLLPGTTQLRAAEQSTPDLDAALTRAEMQSVGTVEIVARPLSGAGGPSKLRDANNDEAILLELPDMGPTAGQCVLSVDEAGAVSWHFPLENGAIQPPASRGAGGTKRFLIRKYQPSAPPGAGASRSLFGVIGKKILKAIVYPITDALIGMAAPAIAEHWESKHRAYGLRDFLPTNYNGPGRDLTSADVKSLAAGKALLFVHGTFSTTTGAFGRAPVELVKKLHERYSGRVFSFNHYTLSHDPARNAAWLAEKLRELSPDSRIEADIICHSRGGLVARALAEASLGAQTERLRVGRIVFVAVPNNGTPLAQPDHMVNMIDRLTTGLNLMPPGTVADVLDGILIAVKIIGHGALNGLEGLQSMNLKKDFLKKLNSGGSKAVEYYAVSADYEPQDPGLKAIVRGAIDAAMDRVFEKAGNDLVVPESGVYEANGSACFPIPDSRRLQLAAKDGRAHSSLFDFPSVAHAIDKWLQ